jgi:hypothetical protein
MSQDDSVGASMHLKIALAQTPSWPLLQLSIQRALYACTERSNVTDVPSSCVELLLWPDTCKLLSLEERMEIQTMVSPSVCLNPTSAKEKVWTHNDTCKTKPLFQFAVSYLNSTHAAYCDAVIACVSIRSCLSFRVLIEPMQLLKTSGSHKVSNLEHHKSDRWLLGKISFTNKHGLYQSIKVNPNELAVFFTALLIPSNLSLTDQFPAEFGIHQI